MTRLPEIVPQTLGQRDDDSVNTAAWSSYLRSVRDSMVGSWNDARDAYLTLKQVRESFGLPLVEPVAEGARTPGALSPEEDQDFVYLNGVVGLLSTWMDEALAGKRRVFVENGDFQIEMLPEDTMRIEEGPGGRPSIVDAETGAPVPVERSVGDLRVVFGALAVTAVAGVALYFAADRMASGLEVMAETKMTETVVREQSDLVQSGRATPEEAERLTGAIFQGAREMKKARAEEKAEKTGWQQTITTVAWVALGIATVLTIGRVVPAFGGGKRGC